jgi:predicted transporter
MPLHPIQYVMWLASPALQAGIVFFMFRRKLNSHYPIFFNYTLLQVLTSLFLFGIKHFCPQPASDYIYYFGFWGTTLLSSLMAFGVLHEIFKDAFRPFEALADLSSILFRWAALVVLLVAGMATVTASNSNQVDTVTNTILLVQRNIRVMQCGLIFFLILFSEYLGISRRHVLFGIAVGFGFFAAINMLFSTAMSHGGGFLKHSTLNEINSAAYLTACLIWLAYVAYPKTLRAGESGTEARSKDWNEALEDARAHVQGESLLDSMDKTVEQLLYHRQQRKANIPFK